MSTRPSNVRLSCGSLQSSEAHPTVMLFALIALEKFSQTSKLLFFLSQQRMKMMMVVNSGLAGSLCLVSSDLFTSSLPPAAVLCIQGRVFLDAFG